jgi:hypothetical protein
MPIELNKWYVVSSQGVEKGPYGTYKEAKDNRDNAPHCVPMYGEQVLDTFGEE